MSDTVVLGSSVLSVSFLPVPYPRECGLTTGLRESYLLFPLVWVFGMTHLCFGYGSDCRVYTHRSIYYYRVFCLVERRPVTVENLLSCENLLVDVPRTLVLTFTDNTFGSVHNNCFLLQINSYHKVDLKPSGKNTGPYWRTHLTYVSSYVDRSTLRRYFPFSSLKGDMSPGQF